MSVPPCQIPLRAALPKLVSGQSAHEQKLNNALCLRLGGQVRILSPLAVHRSLLLIHDAPPRADHLKREIARGAHPRQPPPPPAATGEEGYPNDALVLVAPEELAFDVAAFDVLLEPRERLGRVGLRRSAKMRCLVVPRP